MAETAYQHLATIETFLTAVEGKIAALSSQHRRTMEQLDQQTQQERKRLTDCEAQLGGQTKAFRSKLALLEQIKALQAANEQLQSELAQIQSAALLQQIQEARQRLQTLRETNDELEQ